MVILDSYKVLQCSLAEASQHTTPQAPVCPLPASRQAIGEWACRVAHLALSERDEAIWQAFGLNMTLFCTPAGMAIHHFRASHLPCEGHSEGSKTSHSLVSLPEDSDSGLYHCFSQQMYVGNGVISPGLGKMHKRVYVYDINGMYPFCMASAPMPGGSFTFSHCIDLSDPRTFGWVRALARAPQGRVPCLLP